MDEQHDEDLGISGSGPAFPDAFHQRLAAGIGQGARLARETQRMTQADVAAKIGVTVTYYARIERGRALPGVTTLARLVGALDLELDAIIERAAGGKLPRPAPPSDPLPVRRLARRLRRASPSALALVTELLAVLASDE